MQVAYDRDFWEGRWAQALREHPGALAARPPSPYLLDLADVPPGGALDAHVAGPVGEMVQRLASAVAPGGTLLLVGHRPVDPATGEPTPAAGQTQVSVAEAVDALDPELWSVVLAEERRRGAEGSGVDAVVQAIRLRE